MPRGKAKPASCDSADTQQDSSLGPTSTEGVPYLDILTTRCSPDCLVRFEGGVGTTSASTLPEGSSSSSSDPTVLGLLGAAAAAAAFFPHISPGGVPRKMSWHNFCFPESKSLSKESHTLLSIETENEAEEKSPPVFTSGGSRRPDREETTQFAAHTSVRQRQIGPGGSRCPSDMPFRHFARSTN